jgi:hypothetical protein
VAYGCIDLLPQAKEYNEKEKMMTTGHALATTYCSSEIIILI